MEAVVRICPIPEYKRKQINVTCVIEKQRYSISIGDRKTSQSTAAPHIYGYLDGHVTVSQEINLRSFRIEHIIIIIIKITYIVFK